MQQPLHRDERHDGGDDETDRQIAPVLVVRSAVLRTGLNASYAVAANMVGMPTRNANSAAAGREVMPASIAAKIVAAEREVPGNTAARICADADPERDIPGERVAAPADGRIRLDREDHEAADDQRQATGATVSGSSSPSCFATKPPTTVIRNAAAA